MAIKKKLPKLRPDVRAIVGGHVRRLRVEAGITQQALANKCGIFRTYLSRIESGDANITIVVLAALATNLDVGAGELFVE